MFQFHQNNSQLLFHVIVSLRGAGAFSRDFTTNLARQCRGFSRALKNEKLKAPIFPGPGGAGDTNDWCITYLPLKIYQRFIIYSRLIESSITFIPGTYLSNRCINHANSLAYSGSAVFKLNAQFNKKSMHLERKRVIAKYR